MDNQTQHLPDSATTQISRKRKTTRTAQSGQMGPTGRDAPQAQPPQAQTAEHKELQSPTRQLSTGQPDPARQVTVPQPILFPEVETVILAEPPAAQPHRQRFGKTRRLLRSRTGRILVPLLALLVGLAAGFGSILWYGLSGTGTVVLIPESVQGNLIVEANQDFVTQLVRHNMTSMGLPGQVKNVNVTLTRGDALTVQGDDVYSLLGLSLSRHFVVNVQPYIHTCVLQVRVTHANLGGIPVTGFVQHFEGGINQQLRTKPEGLPSGFTYCAVGVRTEPGGMFLTYKAVSISS